MTMAIATNNRVERAELEEFLRPRHRAIVLTTRADGGPQLSPVTCGLDAEGRLVVSTYPERAKAVNVRARGQVAACVLSDEWNGPWVQIEGTGEIIDPPDSVEPLVDYYRAVAGEHPDWDEYREAMVRQAKSLLRLTITRWGPIATGGFPARLA
ncbi:PPOX class F420-dependent oxidoreductase [Ruania halotolerans]|uniref:PPOX class F420-dependent oxidoreductase n=1 Tax=Ruania halotolerans TaxID=2897773 RepID=UPI001E54BC8F|nr:PPOX class F420-dependent oxidoreductase [Ruania halotolerans]UFU08455.1 PPOX class F420-dependent oxidoreductase [Ruania halotolerans]